MTYVNAPRSRGVAELLSEDSKGGVCGVGNEEDDQLSGMWRM